MRAGHALSLLQGGDEYFPALARAISLAQHDIWLETYILQVSGEVEPLMLALIQAAQRGVTVHLVVDGVGTPSVPSPWRERLDAAGVRLKVFRPLGRFGLLLPSRWRRLHRKLCVVDGDLAFCGGINLLDDRIDPNHGPLAAPRFDFAVQVRGPLVSDMQQAMARLWSRLTLSALVRQRTAPDEPRHAGPVRAELVLRDNLRNRRRIEQAYLRAMGAARHEIIIANAYFLPAGRILRALLHAARRGVSVKILLQGRYEYFLQYHGARPVYGALLRAGVEIHEYEPSFLHAKVAVIDAHGREPWSTVGSSNLDPLSLLLAREANVVSADAVFAAQLHARLETAMRDHGQRLDPADDLGRPWRTRALDWLAYGLVRLVLLLLGKRY